MSKRIQKHHAHQPEPCWIVTWYWKPDHRYKGRAHTAHFDTESEALEYAYPKRFGMTNAPQPKPITQVYVSKVEPVMRWELDHE